MAREGRQHGIEMYYSRLEATSLLSADILYTSSDLDPQVVPEQFCAECEAAEVRISANKTEAVMHSQKGVDYSFI